MLLLPLAQSDRNHAPAFSRLMRAFGPYPNERALILPTPDAYNDPFLRRVVDELASCFSPDNVKIEVAPNNFEGGWPYGPNSHFKFAMETASILGWDNDVMLWMEADLMPVRPDWLQKVRDDYRMAASPFRGMLEKTRFEVTDPKTKQVTPSYPGTVHLVGAGLYPPHYIQYTTPPTEEDRKAGRSKGSPMASYRSPSYSIPFDVRCEAQHIPATQSPLWLHKPRTVNWHRVEGNVFSCDDRAKDPFGLTYAGPCDLTGVCLVHGPKDESFAEAILEGPPVAGITATEFAKHQGNYVDKNEFPQAQHAPIEIPRGGGDQLALSEELSREKQRSELLVDQISELKEDIEQQIADNKELKGDNEKLAQANLTLLSQVESLSQLNESSKILTKHLTRDKRPPAEEKESPKPAAKKLAPGKKIAKKSLATA
jgi:hypothetical protein